MVSSEQSSSMQNFEVSGNPEDAAFQLQTSLTHIKTHLDRIEKYLTLEDLTEHDRDTLDQLIKHFLLINKILNSYPEGNKEFDEVVDRLGSDRNKIRELLDKVQELATRFEIDLTQPSEIVISADQALESEQTLSEEEQQERPENLEEEFERMVTRLSEEIRDFTRRVFEDEDGEELLRRYEELIAITNELLVNVISNPDYDSPVLKTARLNTIKTAIEDLKPRIDRLIDSVESDESASAYEVADELGVVLDEITNDLDEYESEVYVSNFDYSATSRLSDIFSDLQDHRETAQPLLESLEIEIGSLENKYKHGIGDAQAQRAANNLKRNFVEKAEQIFIRIDNLLFNMWQGRTIYDLPGNFANLDGSSRQAETSDPVDSGQPRMDLYNAYLNRIGQVENEISVVNQYVNDDSNFDINLIDRQKEYLVDGYLNPGNGELDRRKQAAFEFWANNLLVLYPEVAIIDGLNSEFEAHGAPDGEDLQQLMDEFSDAIESLINLDLDHTPNASRYAEHLSATYIERAKTNLADLDSDYKLWLGKRDYGDIDILGELTDENALAWLRDQLTVLESSIDERAGQQAGDINHTQVMKVILKMKKTHPEIGSKVEREYNNRISLHNDFRVHVLAEQFVTDSLKNPDMTAGAMNFFYGELNQEIPIAHARRLISRAFQNRLAGTTTDRIDSSNFFDHEDEVEEVVIQRLIDESGLEVTGSSGDEYQRVTQEQASLAFKLAYRIAYIEHEQAWQDFGMKQKQPDKFRDYFWFDKRQIYYAGKDRTASTFVAATLLFSDWTLAEQMPEGSMPPVVLLPQVVESTTKDVDDTGKLQFDTDPYLYHPRFPGYTFIGDVYCFAETDSENKEVIYDPYENRFRHKILADVTAGAPWSDDLKDVNNDSRYGYVIAEGERMHEMIEWDRVANQLHQLYITQLFNVKSLNDDLLLKTDMSAADLSSERFYEGVRIPSDYCMNTTYRVRDADISLAGVAESMGVTDVDLINLLKNPNVDNREKILSLMENGNFSNSATLSGISEEDLRMSLESLTSTNQKELQMQIHEVAMLGYVLHNYVEKQPGQPGKWIEGAEREVSEVLEAAKKAGFIREESIKWIRNQIPIFRVAFKDFVHQVSERMRKEGL